MGLYIRKSQQKDEWILYNPDSFETCHTHCRHKRVAVKIKYLVEHHIVPQSHDIQFVDSCIRVTKNKHYLNELRVYVQTIFWDCRCTISQRAKWRLDNEELERLKVQAEYFELDKTENFNDYKSKYLEKSGAISGARNLFGDKAQKHAETYYGLVRSMTTDVVKISKTTGISEKDSRYEELYIPRKVLYYIIETWNHGKRAYEIRNGTRKSTYWDIESI